jgi:hypothetical protein
MRRLDLRVSSIGLGVICLMGTAMPAGAQELGPFDPKTGLYGTIVQSGATRHPDTLTATSSKVWNNLIKIYSDFGVNLTVADTTRSVLGAVRIAQRRPVDGKRFSLLLECGSSTYGENADKYAVKLTWLTHLQEVGGGKTVVEMRVGGDASPLGSNSTVHCESTGKLEELVADALRKATAS